MHASECLVSVMKHSRILLYNLLINAVVKLDACIEAGIVGAVKCKLVECMDVRYVLRFKVM